MRSPKPSLYPQTLAQGPSLFCHFTWAFNSSGRVEEPPSKGKKCTWGPYLLVNKCLPFLKMSKPRCTVHSSRSWGQRYKTRRIYPPRGSLKEAGIAPQAPSRVRSGNCLSEGKTESAIKACRRHEKYLRQRWSCGEGYKEGFEGDVKLEMNTED